MNNATAPTPTATTKITPKVRPVTIGLPEPIYRRVRILCASRDQTLGSFFTALCEQAVSALPNELADVLASAEEAA